MHAGWTKSEKMCTWCVCGTECLVNTHTPLYKTPHLRGFNSQFSTKYNLDTTKEGKHTKLHRPWKQGQAHIVGVEGNWEGPTEPQRGWMRGWPVSSSPLCSLCWALASQLRLLYHLKTFLDSISHTTWEITMRLKTWVAQHKGFCIMWMRIHLYHNGQQRNSEAYKQEDIEHLSPHPTCSSD